MDPGYIAGFNKMYQDIANKERVVLYNPRLNDKINDTRYWLPDKVHPNRRGQKLLAQDVLLFFSSNWK